MLAVDDGIDAFASVLKSAWYCMNTSAQPCCLCKVDFY